jgi:hypothetical protein
VTNETRRDRNENDAITPAIRSEISPANPSHHVDARTPRSDHSVPRRVEVVR